MSNSISKIEGIGPVNKEKLSAAGIVTVENLLEKGASKSGRKEIAAASGIDEKVILNWVNMADLFRIKGIASQFAGLLNLTNAVPALSKVTDFIEQAKNLDPVVTH